MMFGFSKEVDFKHQIFLYLDQQRGSTTTEAIATELRVLTNQTTLKYLKEMQESLASLYSEEQLSLQIGKRFGVQLIREEANYQRFFEKIYSEEVVYVIYRRLLLERAFEAEVFCEQNAISLSTLRRLINRMNQALKPYQVFIRVGKDVSIIGDEARIRLLLFTVFYHVHRKISEIPWIEGAACLEMSQQICETYFDESTEERLEVLALWLFINLHSESLGKRITRELFDASYSILYTNDQCSPATWRYIFLVMYGLDFFDFQPILTYEALQQNTYSKTARDWLSLFEKHVRMLTKEEKEQFFIQVYQYALIERVIDAPEVCDSVFHLTNPMMLQSFNYYAIVFEQLWQLFIAQQEQPEKSLSKERLKSWTFQFMSSKELLPSLRCAWRSNLPISAIKRLEKVLQWELMQVASLHFVADCEQADLILSTEPTTQGIAIAEVPSEQDFTRLKKAIDDWLRTQQMIFS